MNTLVRHLPDLQATRALGDLLGRTAPAGAVVALGGDLGAGKTSLAQGVGAGLGVPDEVVSPTFVVVQDHPGGRLPLVHADLYRIEDEAELLQVGLEDRLDEGGVVLIEWAERFPDLLPSDHLRIVLRDAGGGREAELTATGPLHAAWLEAVHGGG